MRNDPIAIGDTEKIAESIHDAYEFLTDKCISFLNQFDEMSNPLEDGDDDGDDKGTE